MTSPHPMESLSVRAHKNQFIWQILIPMIVIGGLIVAGAVLVVTGGASRTGVGADISIIWLIAPVLFFALLPLAILIAVIYGMAKLLKAIPHYTGKTQGFFALLSAKSRTLGDGAAKPFVWFQQVGAGIKSIIKF
jgi:hypothetical protein